MFREETNSQVRRVKLGRDSQGWWTGVNANRDTELPARRETLSQDGLNALQQPGGRVLGRNDYEHFWHRENPCLEKSLAANGS